MHKSDPPSHLRTQTLEARQAAIRCECDLQITSWHCVIQDSESEGHSDFKQIPMLTRQMCLKE